MTQNFCLFHLRLYCLNLSIKLCQKKLADFACLFAKLNLPKCKSGSVRPLEPLKKKLYISIFYMRSQEQKGILLFKIMIITLVLFSKGSKI